MGGSLLDCPLTTPSLLTPSAVFQTFFHHFSNMFSTVTSESHHFFHFLTATDHLSPWWLLEWPHNCRWVRAGSYIYTASMFSHFSFVFFCWLPLLQPSQYTLPSLPTNMATLSLEGPPGFTTNHNNGNATGQHWHAPTSPHPCTCTHHVTVLLTHCMNHVAGPSSLHAPCCHPSQLQAPHHLPPHSCRHHVTLHSCMHHITMLPALVYPLLILFLFLLPSFFAVQSLCSHRVSLSSLPMDAPPSSPSRPTMTQPPPKTAMTWLQHNTAWWLWHHTA